MGVHRYERLMLQIIQHLREHRIEKKYCTCLFIYTR